MSHLPRWVRSLSFLLVLITFCASLPPSVLVASPRARPTARHPVLSAATAASIALPPSAQLVPTATPTVTLILPPVDGREARTADLKSVYLPLIVKSATETEPTEPQEAGTSRYVRSYWQETGTQKFVRRDGESFYTLPFWHSHAFARGHNAFAGQPNNTIILAFGRQLEPGRELSDGTKLGDEWHVLVLGDEPVGQRAKNRAWIVETVVQFVKGYVFNPAHSHATIAIGTSNANYAWDCGNMGTGSVDQGDHWEAAGEEWRAVVREINTRLSQDPELARQVTVVGANDIETWFGEEFFWETEDENGVLLDPPEQAWIGCASGTLKWFDGWEAASSSDESPPIVINFGSNAWTEVQGVDKDDVVGDVRARFAFGNQWTRDDLLEVTGKHPDRERLYIRNYPQIYCPGQETSWVPFAEWAIVNSSTNNPLFDGVTSENKGSRLCGTTNGTNISLFWQESWTTLNDALLVSDIINGSHIPEPLRRSVISFYHSHLSIDEP